MQYIKAIFRHRILRDSNRVHHLASPWVGDGMERKKECLQIEDPNPNPNTKTHDNLWRRQGTSPRWRHYYYTLFMYVSPFYKWNIGKVRIIIKWGFLQIYTLHCLGLSYWCIALTKVSLPDSFAAMSINYCPLQFLAFLVVRMSSFSELETLDQDNVISASSKCDMIRISSVHKRYGNGDFHLQPHNSTSFIQKLQMY